MITTRQALSLVFKGKEKRSKYIAEWLAGNDLSFYGPTVAGVVVNETTAYNLPAVLACVKVLAEDISSLPFILYRRLPRGGKERAFDHPLYSILHDQPNDYMTAMSFKEALQGHLGTWGNAYAEIEYGNNAQVKALWPLHPGMTEPKLDNNGKLFYSTRLPDGTTSILPAYRMLHIPGFGFNGLKGYGMISLNKEVIALGMAAQQYTIKYFENGAAPGVVLQYEGELDEKARKNLKESWEEAHGGLSKAHRVAIIEYGLTIDKVGFNPEQSQLLGIRKLQIEEVCRIYRMPPHKVQDLTNATYSNIESENIQYVIGTLQPWCVRWEQAVLTRLLQPNERREYFAEILLDGLLRGDMVSRWTAYNYARYAGVLSANEIRDKENMNPYEGGDERWMPTNMAPISQLMVTPPTPQRQIMGTIVPDIEKRDRIKVVKNRARIQKAWQGVFEDAASRVVKREVQDLEKAAKKIFTKGNRGDWVKFVEDYYKDFPSFVQKAMTPTFLGYAESIQAAAAQEVDAFVGMSVGLKECVLTHIDFFSKYHAKQSLAYLRVALDKRKRDVEDMRDPEDYEIIADELDGWEKQRPKDISLWETVRTNGLVSKAVFFYAGIKGIEWVASGPQGYIPSPMCEELDGVIVEIRDDCGGGSFWQDRSDHRESEQRNDFKPSWVVATPPLYLGCQCQIRAVTS